MLSEQEITGLLDGSLPPEEQARLWKLVENDPEARRQLREQSQMDNVLRVTVGSTEANERVKQSILAVVRGESEEAIKQHVLEDTTFSSRSRRRQPARASWLAVIFDRPAWAFSFAAACLCVFAGIWLAKRPDPKQPASLALAIETPARVDFPAGTAYYPNHPTANMVQMFRNAGSLVPKGSDGLRVSDSGSSTLTFIDGTVLHLEPGTEVRFESAAKPPRIGGKQLKLVSGALSADVAKQPEGLPLLIETPHALVTVVGTEFDLSVATNQTELEVTRGLVKLTGTDTTQPVSVAAGEFAVVAPQTAVRYGRLARNPYLWPFSSESIWNRPLGSQARLLSLPELSFVTEGPLANVLRPRRPFLGSAGDPLRRICVNGEVRADIRLADGNLPRAGMRDSIVLLQHGRRYALELLDPRVRPDGDLEATDIERVPLNGPGMMTNPIPSMPFGLSSFGGLLRVGELENGIRHALAARVSRDRLAGRDFSRPLTIWPAAGNPADPVDQPLVCVGTLLAINPFVDIRAFVGDSGPGYELGRAMQDYGVYVTGFTDAPFVLLADEAHTTNIDELVTKLVPLLQVVVNNSPATSVTGGGTSRRESAPPLPGEWK